MEKVEVPLLRLRCAKVLLDPLARGQFASQTGFLDLEATEMLDNMQEYMSISPCILVLSLLLHEIVE